MFRVRASARKCLSSGLFCLGVQLPSDCTIHPGKMLAAAAARFSAISSFLDDMAGSTTVSTCKGSITRVFFRSKTTSERRERTRATCVCSCLAGRATAPAGGRARRRHQIPADEPNPSEALAGTESGFRKSAGIWPNHTQSFADIQDPCTFGPAIIGYKGKIALVSMKTRFFRGISLKQS